MKTIVLISSEKPLLNRVRQGLSSLTCGRVCITVPVTTETAFDICAQLGMPSPPTGMEFSVMPGIHEADFGRVSVRLVRGATPEKALRELSHTPDELYAVSVSDFARCRRLMGEGTVLRFAEKTDKVPACLVPLDDGWQLRHQSELRSCMCSDERSAVIVGAGLAGAMTAYELGRRGWKVTVLDAGCVPGSGASALYAGLIHPHWQASDSPLFQLTRAGFEAMVSLMTRFPEVFNATGVMDAASSLDEYERWREAWIEARPIAMPESFAHLLTRAEASERTGLDLSRGGWFYPKAGLVHAGRLVRRLLEASGARVLPNTSVRLLQADRRWRAVGLTGVTLAQAPVAVVCAALGSASVLGLDRDVLGLHPLYGRISLLRDTDLPTLRCALTGDGYVAKTTSGFCAVGATYESGEEPQISSEMAHEHNLQTFDKLMGCRPTVLAAGFYEGIRAVPTDRMPLAGRGFIRETLQGVSFRGVPELRAIPRAEGLWICAGLGSRGLTWGLSCAQKVASEICAEPAMISATLADKLDPARFLPKRLVVGA